MKSEQKLCDNCHERPGINHICYGGGGESRSLCAICLKQDLEMGGLMRRFDEAVRVGHCKYCGAPAMTAYGGSSSSITGDHFNLVCMACFEDLVEFAGRPENAKSDFAPSVAKKVKQLADFQRRQDEFIRERVSKRKSK